MEDILKKANELGLLIKQTEACRDFEELSAEIEKDDDASSLLKKYNEIAGIIQNKNEAGDTIEKYEQEMFKALTATVTENKLILEYLKARDVYVDLLMKIHKSISGSI